MPGSVALPKPVGSPRALEVPRTPLCVRKPGISTVATLSHRRNVKPEQFFPCRRPAFWKIIFSLQGTLPGHKEPANQSNQNIARPHQAWHPDPRSAADWPLRVDTEPQEYTA